MFRPESRATRLRPRRAHGVLVGAIALLMVVGTPLSSVADAAPGWGPGWVSWTNGLVLCQFPRSLPFVTVSPEASNTTGLTIGLEELREVTSGGSLIAYGNLSGADWRSTNDSDTQAYDFGYAVNVSLSVPGSSEAEGSAEVGVDYDLPAFSGSSAGDPNIVAVQLSVRNWTWDHPGDALEAGFAAWPVSPTAEHLGGPARPGQVLTDDSNATGAETEWVTASPFAVISTGEAPQNVSASPTLVLSSPASAHIAVLFASYGGEYRSLEYGFEVGVTLPTVGQGVSWTDVAIVAGGALAICLGIASATYRLRSGRSRWTYADEEER